MHICIFEDINYRNFLPLVHFRPVYNLHCGALSLQEKIRSVLPKAKIIFHMRNELVNTFVENFSNLIVNKLPSDDVWFINGRLKADDSLAKLIRIKSGVEKLFLKDENLIAAFIKKENLPKISSLVNGQPLVLSLFKNLPIENYSGKLFNFPWELVHNCAEQIEKDFKLIKVKEKISGKIYLGTHLINKKNIIIGKGSKIKSGAVLDAEKGPIIIGRNVTIMPNAVIEGPAFIGDNSIIKVGAKIYHGTSIGKWCKIGGEVETSIIQSFTNKQHDGFLGHSYLGSWVNIGAGTNTSDLKNNYSTVKVYINGKLIDSGQQFIGLTMGDHSKSGINTMFSTGTVVGVSSNYFGFGFSPKFIPSFTWGDSSKFVTYELEKAIETMKKVMLRRGINMSTSYEKLARTVFDMTIEERKESGVL